MNHNLMSRDECFNITKDSEVFYCSKVIIQGFIVEMYNYRLASLKDFYPINENNRSELRGYTFIYNPKTNNWENHIALNKFFNINQTTMENIYHITFEDKTSMSVSEYFILNSKLKTDIGKMKPVIHLKEGDEILNISSEGFPFISNSNYFCEDKPDIDHGKYEKQLGRKILISDYKKVQTIEIEKRGWMEEDLVDKDILSISDKMDGSLILPIKLPNGNIVMKTKMSFDSPQAIEAQIIYENNKNYIDFVDYCERLGIQTMWEYTSYDNQIVLSYNEKQLSLLQARHKKTGQYLTQSRLENIALLFNIKITFQYNIEKIKNIISDKNIIFLKNTIEDKKFKTLNSMLDFIDNLKCLEESQSDKITLLDFIMFSKDYIDNEEGVVIMFSNNQLGKVKNLKYFQLHGLVTEGTRENLLIQTILEDNIDDVLSQVNKGAKRDFIISINNKVQRKFNKSIVEVKEILSKYNGNRKKFAIEYNKCEFFSVLMKSLNSKEEKDISNNLKEYFLKITNGLEKSKKWLDTINDEE